MARGLLNEKDLIIIKKDDEINLIIDDTNDGRIWTIKPEFYDRKGFMILEKKNGYLTRVIEKKYKTLGINNMCELFELIKKKPKDMIENLIGEKIGISKVVIRNLSEKYKDKFESCDQTNNRGNSKRKGNKRKA